jgi:hypothetical protein
MRAILTALAIVAAPAAHADCATFLNWFGGDASHSDDVTQAMQQICASPDWLTTVAHAPAVEEALPAKAQDDLTGTWRNTFWTHVAMGVSIPLVEVLDVRPDGQVTRTVLRWSDPASYLLDATLPRRVPEYRPVLTSARLVFRDGRVDVVERADTGPDLACCGMPAEDQARLEAVFRIGLTDLTGPLHASRTPNYLVLKDHMGRVRTYRATTEDALTRAHRTILAAEQSAAANWTCLIGRIEAGGLTAETDMALQLHSLFEEREAARIEDHNARLADPDHPGDALRDVMLRSIETMDSMREKPDFIAFMESAGASEPFGCPKPFWY